MSYYPTFGISRLLLTFYSHRGHKGERRGFFSLFFVLNNIFDVSKMRKYSTTKKYPDRPVSTTNPKNCLDILLHVVLIVALIYSSMSFSYESRFYVSSKRDSKQ